MKKKLNTNMSNLYSKRQNKNVKNQNIITTNIKTPPTLKITPKNHTDTHTKNAGTHNMCNEYKTAYNSSRVQRTVNAFLTPLIHQKRRP